MSAEKRDFPKARLRLVLVPGVAFGPGKADLLEGIAETGSLSAAGKRLRMSYKRAWLLISELNAQFSQPLVETEKGGSGGGGGSRLTPLGKDVLATYRRIEASFWTNSGADVDALARLTAPSLDREDVPE